MQNDTVKLHRDIHSGTITLQTFQSVCDMYHMYDIKNVILYG